MRTFLATETRVQFHEWLAIGTGSLVQAALLVFVWVLDPALLPITVVGAMSYSVFLIGQRVLNEAAYIRIDHKLNELYHASPMTPESYFLGMSLGILIAYTPPLVVLLLILLVIYPAWSLPATGMLVLVLIAIWAFSASLGYFISTLFKDMKTIWPYSSLLTNLFGIVPPVFFPIYVLTAKVPWAWVPALLVPTSSAAALVESVAGMPGVSLTVEQYGVAGFSLAIEAGLMLLFGLYWARRTAREA